MTTTAAEFLNVSGGVKCRDDGWITLIGKVHGHGIQVYVPVSIDNGCSIIAKPLVGKHVGVTINDSLTFISLSKVKKRLGLVIPVPWKFRRLIAGLGLVKVKLRPNGGDDGN